MNLTLLAKEIRGLALCAWLALGLSAFFTGYAWLTDFPDIQDEEDGSGSGYIEMAVFFGLLIGARVLAQEREEETQGFLDGLPVSRAAVFAHKTLAAMLVMTFALIVSELPDVMFDGLRRTSLSEPFAWDEWFSRMVLWLLLGAMVVALSMLISFARGSFPLIAGLVLWAFVWLRASGADSAEWLDSAVLMRDPLPLRAMAGHGALTLAALLAALVMFQWRIGRVSLWLARMSQRRGVSLLAWPARIGALMVWIMVINMVADRHEPDEEDQSGPAESRAAGDIESGDDVTFTGFERSETDRYEVVFRTTQSMRVRELLHGMDAVHGQVADYFQHPPSGGARIVVDVASIVSRHAAGQTNWTKIRVPLSGAIKNDEFQNILRHETAHVFIEQLSRGAASDHFNAMRAFHEGVASAVELTGDDRHARASLAKMERSAALADARGRVPLELLCDDKALRNKRDPNLAYPLGFVFAQALRDTGGLGLPRRVLEALHEKPPPPRADASTLWRHVLQQCGSSFDHVIAAYETRLDQLALRESKLIAALPRLSATVTREGADIVLRPVVPAVMPDGAAIVCAIERHLGLLTELEFVSRRADGSFLIPRAAITRGSVRHMLGWKSKQLALPVFEPWTEARP